MGLQGNGGSVADGERVRYRPDPRHGDGGLEVRLLRKGFLEPGCSAVLQRLVQCE